MIEEIKVHKGSSSIFTDLGLESSDELLVKAELAQKITGIINQQKLTQTKAAEILGIDQPKISALMHGKLAGFSTVRLFRFLNALGRDVEIVVRAKPKSRDKAQTRVVSRPLKAS